MGALSCETPEVFVVRTYSWQDLDEYVPDALIEQLPGLLARLPPGLRTTVSAASFNAMPIQVHAVFMGLFASLIAPFGEGFCECWCNPARFGFGIDRLEHT
jgi:hypothetical protein